MRILANILLPAMILSASAVTTKADDLPVGDINYVVSKIGDKDRFNGKTLRSIFTPDGINRHQGYRIFNDQIMSTSPDSLVLNFIERYLLLLDLLGNDAVAAQRMADDHVVFISGSRKDLIDMTDDDLDISIERRGWSQKREIMVLLGKPGSQNKVVMTFPPSYELVLGMTRRELEEEFPVSLAKSSSEINCMVSIPETQQIDSVVCGSSSFEWFEHEELNNRTYYRMENDELSPICSDSMPGLSAANLFNGALEEDRTMNLMQQLYGFKENGIVTSVSRWLNYCHDNGLTTYFAVEKEFPDHLLAFVTAVHPTLMYLHLLSLEIPLDVASNKNVMINGKVRTFIPTHNLQTLYQEKD